MMVLRSSCLFARKWRLREVIKKKQIQTQEKKVFLRVEQLGATKVVCLAEGVAVESSEAQAPLCELQQSFGEAELWLAEVGVREGEEASRSSQSKFRSGHVGESR